MVSEIAAILPRGRWVNVAYHTSYSALSMAALIGPSAPSVCSGKYRKAIIKIGKWYFVQLSIWNVAPVLKQWARTWCKRSWYVMQYVAVYHQYFCCILINLSLQQRVVRFALPKSMYGVIFFHLTFRQSCLIASDANPMITGESTLRSEQIGCRLSDTFVN